MGPQWVMHPPFSFVLPKENAPCTVEKKSASSKLARAGKFGDANGRKPPPDKTCQVSSRCTITWQSSSLQAASCDASSHSKVLVKAFSFSSRCRSVGGVSKEGAAAPSLCRLKGRSRRGRPKSPSWRVFWTGRGPFSPRGENGGASAQLSSWLSPKKKERPPPGSPSFKTAPPGPAAHHRRWCAAAGRSHSTAGRQWPFSG